MLPTVALLTLLPMLTSASPTFRSQTDGSPNAGPVYLRASAPDTLIDNEIINASNNSFFIGKNTHTSALPCPASDGCSFPTNVTAVNIDLIDGSVSMDSSPAAGGQSVYVGSDYVLHFKSAHDHTNNTGELYHGFGYSPATFGQNHASTSAPNGYQLTFSANGEQGFFACPDGQAGEWKVYASEGAECYYFKAEAITFDQQPGQYAAYEYI